MAVTKLADIVGHQEFAKYFNLQMLEQSVLVKSGIAAPDPVIAAKIAEGSGLEGKTLDMPYLDSLDSAGDSEVPVEETGATAEKISSGNDTAVVQFRRKKFGVTDIARIMRAADPMAQIVAQQVPYWNKQNQKIFLAIIKGVFAANARKAGTNTTENDTNGYLNGCDGDMILDLTAETEESAQILSKDSIMLAAQLLGDHKADLTAVAMPSIVETYLAGLDTNASLYRASEGPAALSKYNGRDIIVDDTVPYDPTTKTATIYLFGKGAVAYNPLPCPHPFELERDPDKAVDYIHAWVREIIHLRGWKWQGASAGLAPTNTELEAAGAWKRVWDKKRIPCVMLKAKLG
ncbi:MAG TPA: hypothetical protein DD637_06240 [Verrucomicrobia bacterium]|nr:hypothetical protein [Verrucomicrobiota bacterium]HCG20702.1 hypothetical protein [Verrucomicrobiota bacterium]